VVLGPETWPTWLGEEPADPRQLKAFLAPYPSEGMTCWPLSPRVGNVKNSRFQHAIWWRQSNGLRPSRPGDEAPAFAFKVARYPRAMCGRACLDATGAVMIITFCGCVTADYFGRVGELFTGDIAEK